ncbi:hypothetical protein TMM008_05360 [Pseudomonas sp. 008]|nr:hypothetical protein TMM008_05360 [Pseudomonas sp. 008]
MPVQAEIKRSALFAWFTKCEKNFGSLQKFCMPGPPGIINVCAGDVSASKISVFIEKFEKISVVRFNAKIEMV